MRDQTSLPLPGAVGLSQCSRALSVSSREGGNVSLWPLPYPGPQHCPSLNQRLSRVQELMSCCLCVLEPLAGRARRDWHVLHPVPQAGCMACRCPAVHPRFCPPISQKQLWERGGLSPYSSLLPLLPHPAPWRPPQTVRTQLRVWQGWPAGSLPSRAGSPRQELCQLSGQTCPHRLGPPCRPPTGHGVCLLFGWAFKGATL